MKVRLYCIDAPEMVQKPWGRRNRDHLRSITPNTVRVLVRDTDRYGRFVAEVFSGGENLNLRQVSTGWAAEYDSYCTDYHYRHAAATATVAREGIWSSVGLHQVPWEYRKR